MHDDLNPYEAPHTSDSAGRSGGFAVVGLSLSGTGLAGMQPLAMTGKFLGPEWGRLLVILLIVWLMAGFVISVASLWFDKPSRTRRWAMFVSVIGLLFVGDLVFWLMMMGDLSER